MKIGIVIDRLNVGGVEKIALEQVTALRKLGVDAELVVLREKAVVENAFMDLREGVPIIYLDQKLPRILRYSCRFPVLHFFSTFHITYPFLLPFVVRKKQYDYLISHGTYTTMTVIALKKVCKIPFSAFIWDPATYVLDRVYKSSMPSPVFKLLRFFTKRLDSFIISNTDSVLVGGDAHNSFIRDINPSKPIEIIFPSVHPILKPTKKGNYVLMATAWKRGKNPEYIIEIAKEINSVPIRLAGRWLDPEYRIEFEMLLQTHNLQERVEIIGEVSECEMSRLYAEALFVLQTNDDRGFGMPALEAAGKATAFIIPEGQGVCELFEDTIDGFYTKEQDTKVIVDLANRFINDKQLAITMGKNGWKKVTNNYSWKKHAEALYEVADRDSPRASR